MGDWFGKNCKHQICQFEKHYTGPGEYEEDKSFPVLVFCTHDKNPDDAEGNCCPKNCPLRYEVFETVSRRAETENTEEARIKKKETYLSLTYGQAYQIVDEAAEMLRYWFFNIDRVEMERSQKGAVLAQVKKAGELARAIEAMIRYNY